VDRFLAKFSKNTIKEKGRLGQNRSHSVIIGPLLGDGVVLFAAFVAPLLAIGFGCLFPLTFWGLSSITHIPLQRGKGEDQEFEAKKP
jgi:hypothetical protein